jgi:hypothetical protein
LRFFGKPLVILGSLEVVVVGIGHDGLSSLRPSTLYDRPPLDSRSIEIAEILQLGNGLFRLGTQASYLKTLAEQGGDPDAYDDILTKAEASKRIDTLK